MAQIHTAGSPEPLPSRLSLALWVGVTVGVGLLIGALTRPDTWYAALAKPSFNPPNWLFGPVWTILYVLIGTAGALVWARAREIGMLPLALWGAQMAANYAWSPTFFGLHRIDLALAIISFLLMAIVAFIAATWRRGRLAALLFVPYAAWVGFATVLNAAFLSLNGAS